MGNIFTGLGLLAEVNHQLGEGGPGTGLQRLSRLAISKKLFICLPFSAVQRGAMLNGWMIVVKAWRRPDLGLSYSLS